MSTTWIVVADASRARIFRADAPNSALTEIDTLAHPESRLHEGDLVSDRTGHVVSSTTGGHNFGRDEVAKHAEADRFAAEVSRHLEQGHNQGGYAKLYLIAPPAFLGLLRQHLPKTVHDMVASEIAKDLTTENGTQIRAQLPEHL